MGLLELNWVITPGVGRCHVPGDDLLGKHVEEERGAAEAGPGSDVGEVMTQVRSAPRR